MQPEKFRKLLVLWVSFTCTSTSQCLLQVDAIWALSPSQTEHKTTILSNIPSFGKNSVTPGPFTKTDEKLEEFPKSELEGKAINLPLNSYIDIQDVQDVQASSIDTIATTNDLEFESIPDVDFQKLTNQKPISVTSFQTAQKTNQVNPIAQSSPPPNPNPPQPEEAPQLEGQPNDFPQPSSGQIEQRLENIEVDYPKRLERLLQILSENKEAPDKTTNGREIGIIARPLEISPPLESPQLPLTPPPKKQLPISKPIGYLQGRISYFHTNNLFASDVDPIQDGLIYSGLTLATAPLQIGPKTYLSGSVDGNIIRYINQSEFNYNQLRLNIDLYHQLSKRMYSEIGWSNQQLFYANNSKRYRFASGDRFLNENSFHLSLGRRDPLTQKLMFDSYYEFRLSLAETPEKRNRINNSLWFSLSYYLQQSFNIGIDYQFNLSSFTDRDREDLYHRLFSHLSYKVSDTSSISAQGGVTIGGSTERNINFDGWFFSINYNWELGKF